MRSRRVIAHALIREQVALMTKLHTGEITIIVEVNAQTGEESHRLKAEYPSEEALESPARRVRPLILSSEPLYTGRHSTPWRNWSGLTPSWRRSSWRGGTTHWEERDRRQP